MTRIKTVRERTSLPSQLAGIVAVVVPPLGLAAAVWLLWDRGVRPLDLALLAVFYVACGLGITVGFHRLFTHKSFETSAPLRALWAILGSMIGAIVLTLRHKVMVKRQDINVQNARTPELAMSVRKVASGQGLQDADAAEWVK